MTSTPGPSRSPRTRSDDAAEAEPGGRQAARSRMSTRRLLQATADLLAEKGYEGTTLVEIGSRAGYSRGLVTRKFGSKASLIEELIDRLSGGFRAENLAKTIGDAVGADAARAVIDAIRTSALDHPRGVRAYYVLTFEALKPGVGLTEIVRNQYRESTEVIAEAVGAGVHHGRLHPDVSPYDVVHLLESGTRGLAYFWMLDPDRHDLPAQLDLLADQIERLCLAPPRRR